MCALGNLAADGVFDVDPHEPPFTAEELERALALREHTRLDWRSTRRDKCPHPTPCESTKVCVQAIAWYLRYRHDIEEQLTDAGLQPI